MCITKKIEKYKYKNMQRNNKSMSQNRVKYFIRNILQNSKLNREKFVINKKKYNMVSKRQYGTHTDPNRPPNNIYILLLLGLYGVSVYHLTRD